MFDPYTNILIVTKILKIQSYIQPCLPALPLWNLPAFDETQLPIGQVYLEGEVRRPDSEEDEPSVTPVLSDDANTGGATSLWAIHVHHVACLRHLPGKNRTNAGVAIDRSSDH